MTSENSRQSRINSAKAYLKENPEEKLVAVAEKFEVQYTTLHSSISRDKKAPIPEVKKVHGGQNKILRNHEVEAIHQFVRSLLMYGI